MSYNYLMPTVLEYELLRKQRIDRQSNASVRCPVGVETYLRYVVTNVTDELRDLSKSGARTVTVVDSTTVSLPRISREV